MNNYEKEFLDTIKELVNFWNNTNNTTTKEKLNGLAFNILTLLDGEMGDNKGYIVKPIDKPTYNISGYLHENFKKEDY